MILQHINKRVKLVPMKNAILLVGYGATHPESWTGLRNFESLCRSKFKNIPVRWAFTSTNARVKMAVQRQKSDSVVKAIMRLHFEKFENIAVQPLQTIPGKEYEELANNVMATCKNIGIKAVIGEPLVKNSEKIPVVAQAIAKNLPENYKHGDNIVFMAHGAKHPAGYLYSELAQAILQFNPDIYIASMSSQPFLSDILPHLRKSGGNVWLMPLLSVIGVHALRDMAGDSPKSWKVQIQAQGCECRTVLKAMTQSRELAALWLDNLQAVIDTL